MATMNAVRFSDLGRRAQGMGRRSSDRRPSAAIGFALVVMSFGGGLVFGEFARLFL